MVDARQSKAVGSVLSSPNRNKIQWQTDHSSGNNIPFLAKKTIQIITLDCPAVSCSCIKFKFSTSSAHSRTATWFDLTLKNKKDENLVQEMPFPKENSNWPFALSPEIKYKIVVGVFFIIFFFYFIVFRLEDHTIRSYSSATATKQCFLYGPITFVHFGLVFKIFRKSIQVFINNSMFTFT